MVYRIKSNYDEGKASWLTTWEIVAYAVPVVFTLSCRVVVQTVSVCGLKFSSKGPSKSRRTYKQGRRVLALMSNWLFGASNVNRLPLLFHVGLALVLVKAKVE